MIRAVETQADEYSKSKRAMELGFAPSASGCSGKPPAVQGTGLRAVFQTIVWTRAFLTEGIPYNFPNQASDAPGVRAACACIPIFLLSTTCIGAGQPALCRGGGGE